MSNNRNNNNHNNYNDSSNIDNITPYKTTPDNAPDMIDATPPPSYNDYKQPQHDDEEKPLYPDLTQTIENINVNVSVDNNDNNDNNDDHKKQYNENQDASLKLAQQLQQQLNGNGNGHGHGHGMTEQYDPHFGLSDQEWKLQHELLNNAQKSKQNELLNEYQLLRSNEIPDDDGHESHSRSGTGSGSRSQPVLPEVEEEFKHDAVIPNQNDPKNQEDEDFALALRLNEQQQHLDDDMKIAMQLQKEEELKAKVERARQSRYRNPNFVDFGSQQGDYQSYVRRHVANAVHSDNDDDDDDEVAVFPSRSALTAHMNQFRNMADNDDQGMEDILSAFSIHHSGGHHHHHGFYGMHHAMRRHRHGMGHGVSDSWQRLPTRKLTEKDVEILRKSEEKKTCSICMMEFDIDDTTRQLPCFHEFHKDCVDQWFKQQNDKGKDASCPLDRKKIKAMENQQV
eukprot:CAMPEP_0201573772 /NCGR_PEP_ID=MMETSP0190_2-20130828/17811_1 /ASSEMBLY_ACC=CAM_ASM_000263 /TAXON_ID=37353 /ORGANISM="Rosalina sp." /LENGTH=452 /DNA_ID=CAMNT_0048001123 /DNA_START=877 /DNA_END=2235 /DNA_ORIENTATION=-